MLPPKSGLWPLFSSPPSIPSCLRLLQPEGILPQPASGRTCPSPLPFSSSGDGRSSDGRGRREACTQQGLWLGGGGALLLPSLCHHAPLTPPTTAPAFSRSQVQSCPCPQRCLGPPGTLCPSPWDGTAVCFQKPTPLFSPAELNPMPNPSKREQETHRIHRRGALCCSPESRRHQVPIPTRP